MKVRRSHLCVSYVSDDAFLDMLSLTEGQISITNRPQVVGFDTLCGKDVRLDEDMLEALATVSGDEWEDIDELVESQALSRAAVEKLVGHGLLLSDSEEAGASAAREADLALRRSGWHRVAALYHRMSAWRDFRAPASPDGEPDQQHAEIVHETRRAIEHKIDKQGAPPGHFYGRQPLDRGIPLDRPRVSGPLYDLLLSRKSTRAFDVGQDLPIDKLSALLHYVFGCHGTKDLAPGFTSIKRTSPSGGSMHPAEVYPLIARVDGLDAGLYHYRVEDHALECLEPLSPDEAGSLTTQLSAGQQYFAAAHVCLLFTYRFARLNFKYAGHAKAYKVAMMDIAHLSQSAYLVCTDLGLAGCFYGAINDGDINERLGLDGIAEGAVAAFACGIPDPAGDGQEFRHQPYDAIGAQRCRKT